METFAASRMGRLASRSLRAAPSRHAALFHSARYSTLLEGPQNRHLTDRSTCLPAPARGAITEEHNRHSFQSHAASQQLEVNNKEGEMQSVGPMEAVGQKRLADFDLKGRVFVVTGGASGIGLAMAEGLVEAGGKGTLNDPEENRTHTNSQQSTASTEPQNPAATGAKPRNESSPNGAAKCTTNE